MDYFYQLFQAVYASIKCIFGLNKRRTIKPVQCLLILLTILLLMVAIFCITPLYITFMLTSLCLRILYREKYGGMVKGLDFMMEVTETPIVINVLLVVKRHGSYETFEETLSRNLKKIHESCVKLRYEVKTALIYKYYIKSDVNFENNITVRDGVKLNRDNIAEYVNGNFMNSSHLGNKGWRAIIFKEPIEWSQKSDQPEHVVLLVFRHSIADGIPLLSFIANTLEGFELVSLGNKLKTNPKQQRTSILDEAYIYDNPLKQNQTFLRSSSENCLTFYVEDDVKYIPLIKAIKTKLKIGFTDVIMGCLAAALVTYAKKQGTLIETLKLGTALRSTDKETLDMLEGKFDYNKIYNKVMAITTNSPSNIDCKTLKETVQGCHAACEELMGAADFNVVFALSQFMHVLTIPIARYIFRKTLKAVNLGSSNVVGLQRAAIEGYNIETLIAFISRSVDTGFLLIICSLGNRLQLFFSGPESHLNNSKVLDDILNDMFKNIDTLYDEIN